MVLPWAPGSEGWEVAVDVLSGLETPSYTCDIDAYVLVANAGNLSVLWTDAYNTQDTHESVKDPNCCATCKPDGITSEISIEIIGVIPAGCNQDR